MITIKKHGSAGTIILDRPKQCNALSREMITKLSEALSDLHQEKSVRAVIITGSGSSFCSGIDLKEWNDSAGSRDAEQRWQEDSSELHNLIDQWIRFPKPIIAAVDGAAIGFGFTLVLACDLVVASQRATFALPSPKLGLVSGLAAPLLTFRLGGSIASRMLLGLDEIDVQEARDLGLVHHVVLPEQTWARASQWAQQIATASPEAIQLSKRLLNEMIGENMSMLLATAAATTATACTTENASEGMKSFVEKREPRWK